MASKKPKPSRPSKKRTGAAEVARRRGASPARSMVRGTQSTSGLSEHFEDVVMARELFWNNVIREILTALSTLAVAGADAAAEGVVPGVDGAPTDPLDGRLAVVVSSGERIPIAEVYPLFACGIPGSKSEKALSIAVECTVFQVRTPAGEVYTLPLHEIRGFHALTQDLMNQLSDAASGASSATGEPFGFAAFTELSRSQGLTQASESPTDIAD